MIGWLGPLANTTWVDWLDIGLLTLVIYQVLTAMRGTRALQVLLGGALLGAVYILSEVVGFAAMHWVLDHLFVYLVVALLILFQEDIRRALAGAGNWFAVSRDAGATEASVMEEVIRACFALAKKRIGALIVLERNGSLQAFVDGAHSLDCRVSKEILESIFHPTSPLHDGAVIVSNGRLVAAAAFLPTSMSTNIPRFYGTRHRAAIGLTEETDGLVLVVSEERGTVAVVTEGKVEPVADVNDLRQMLSRQLTRDAKADLEESNA